MSKLDGFEQRELLGKAYLEDPRWKEVERLNKEGKTKEAGSLVCQIRISWGL